MKSGTGGGGEGDGSRGSWGCWDTFSFLAIIVRIIGGLPRKKIRLIVSHY